MANLKFLKLSAMLAELEAAVWQATESSCGYGEFLCSLTDREVDARMENGRTRRIKEAKFPLFKPFETFDFAATPDLDTRLIKELSGCQYIKEARNVILLGRSGTGKTHVAIALGIEACGHGVRSRFTTGCALANELIEARNDKRLSRLIERYRRYGLLIIDLC